jgi:hypothetical protein
MLNWISCLIGTGEHGVGVGKKEYLTDELGEGTVELMKTIKRAIDPLHLFNPGKVNIKIQQFSESFLKPADSYTQSLECPAVPRNPLRYTKTYAYDKRRSNFSSFEFNEMAQQSLLSLLILLHDDPEMRETATIQIKIDCHF